jgi:hypothetical protein
MVPTAFVTGTIVTNRPWRMDDVARNVLTATLIDGSQHDLLLRDCCLSLLHRTAPFLNLQRSHVTSRNYQPVPVVMALEMPYVLLILDGVGLDQITHWRKIERKLPAGAPHLVSLGF